jgi:hypothetical protein
MKSLMRRLYEGRKGVTYETTLTRFKDDIGRRKDGATGLWKLTLEPEGIEGHSRLGRPAAEPDEVENVEAWADGGDISKR